MASVDVATKQNLDDLVKVGEGLLDSPVSRVNSVTGGVEPVTNGGTNREALKRYIIYAATLNMLLVLLINIQFIRIQLTNVCVCFLNVGLRNSSRMN